MAAEAEERKRPLALQAKREDRGEEGNSFLSLSLSLSLPRKVLSRRRAGEGSAAMFMHGKGIFNEFNVPLQACTAVPSRGSSPPMIAFQTN